MAERKIDRYAQDKKSIAGRLKEKRDETQRRLNAIMSSSTTPDESQSVQGDRKEREDDVQGHY